MNKYVDFENNVNMNGIKYPVKVKDIFKFEKQNLAISINVFGFEDDHVFPQSFFSNNMQPILHFPFVMYADFESILNLKMVKKVRIMSHGPSRSSDISPMGLRAVSNVMIIDLTKSLLSIPERLRRNDL